MKTFSDLELKPWIIRQLSGIGLKHPTPIQENCIPKIIEGRDCIGAAKTGSGKTLVFALPILHKLCEDPYGIFALVLTPTRELAFQIGDSFAVIGRAINLRQSIIVGGMDMVAQGSELAKKPHVVIATPGRLADHLESCNTFSLQQIKFLVLDEADRLLGGAFDGQIKTIFSALPHNKQTLLFSATITDTLEKVKQVAKNEVFMWEQKDDIITVEELDQFYVLCSTAVKDGYLVEAIRTFKKTCEKGSIIIFTDTCKNCQLLSIALNEVGFENVALHAMIPQKVRLAALAKFKTNLVKILIATDVASRGLDIPAVELVVNHNIPSIPKDYVHRVGRTARAGRGGTAISLVTPHDIHLVHAIEANINTKLKEYQIDGREVAKIFTQVSVSKREAEIKLDDSDFNEKKKLYKRKKMILEGKDPDEEEQKLEEKRKQFRKEQRKKLRKRMKEKQKAKTDSQVETEITEDSEEKDEKNPV
ncbi:probable ATP-dependent RNA helicase DDX49 isoform X4 [Nilaparvata lugens]|uniref:probable ATP-dependent RNA helicase DDX49 isoform X1 n=2 Tax=Nilaparvata lugens TaxID=108931 RepID=UPI00193D74FF|nr:probable ATP-dependent RNA helicase DDX49 isoform X1 [Nilaparvata lugens]XP_039295325.1 probable ATP-dependent RNA helicase DDX49 isoform X2 [Nilaparvata lugens]XP_039295327.1 probable ATP-dependent RNA helicase DDX49 isoform X3 [Nilaparvata lugens]XP_039295328.1 probable ATP-dependent RNA helicase DDX49 isoform X4 [Nilaparvata lugens]